VRGGFLILLVATVGLAAAVAMGVADPRPVGRLKWEDHFVEGERWEVFGRGVEIGDQGPVLPAPVVQAQVSEAEGLEIEVGRGEIGGAVTRSEGNEFTFEVAGGQVEGEVGAAYGIVFGYKSPASYTAVMINGNGYVQVISADGREHLAWGQWPNILLGYEANRLRVDVQNGEGLIRINDEVLMTVAVADGEVGVIARGSAGGQRVRFGWAKLWGR
jgi:hypothetical protein